jgi:hypothetical protein
MRRHPTSSRRVRRQAGANIVQFRPIPPVSRCTIEVELPVFLVRAFELRVDESNRGARPSEQVTLNNYIELQLAEHLSLADVAILESEIPGVGEAVSRWLDELVSG